MVRKEIPCASFLLLISAACFGQAAAVASPTAAESPPPQKETGLVMLDYQTVEIPGYKPIDLVGFHVLQQLNPWLYAGIGGHAPLLRGEYGGFMMFDATLHARQRISGNLFAQAGVSLGGGGGGRSTEQSKVLSGAGGLLKTYAGIGYDFNGFSAGVNYSRLRLSESLIHNSQFDFYVQTPFSYRASPYSSAGSAFRSARAAEPSETRADIIDVGFDNIRQIHPQGTVTSSINLVEMQYSHFISDHTYVLLDGDLGYRGLPFYNQIFTGLGYQYAVSPRINVRGQLAIGSGGYDPEKINTGSGLLIYPRMFLEYMVSPRVGIALTGGYLRAPNGSSKNATFGALLSFHDTDKQGAGGSEEAGLLSGYRFNLFRQWQSDLRAGGKTQGSLTLLTLQVDKVLSRSFYIPIQASVATSGYFGYPGYGEILAGLGVQSAYDKGDSLQFFSQLSVGSNVRGAIANLAAGVDWGLSERFAIRAQVGSTLAKSSTASYPNPRFRAAPVVGLGLSYRFALGG